MDCAWRLWIRNWFTPTVRIDRNGDFIENIVSNDNLNCHWWWKFGELCYDRQYRVAGPNDRELLCCSLEKHFLVPLCCPHVFPHSLWLIAYETCLTPLGISSLRNSARLFGSAPIRCASWLRKPLKWVSECCHLVTSIFWMIKCISSGELRKLSPILVICQDSRFRIHLVFLQTSNITAAISHHYL